VVIAFVMSARPMNRLIALVMVATFAGRVTLRQPRWLAERGGWPNVGR